MENSTNPKDADYAAKFIARMNKETKSRSARIRMAQLAVTVGNYTPEGKAVWRAYLDQHA